MRGHKNSTQSLKKITEHDAIVWSTLLLTRELSVYVCLLVSSNELMCALFGTVVTSTCNPYLFKRKLCSKDKKIFSLQVYRIEFVAPQQILSKFVVI